MAKSRKSWTPQLRTGKEFAWPEMIIMVVTVALRNTTRLSPQ